MIRDFYDLDCWKESHKLVLEIYKLTATFPKEERYGVSDQLRRAASSITANIAEGFGRYHFADKIRFYYQARGSVKEVESFLLLAKDLGYVGEEKVNELWVTAENSGKLINGLIRSVGPKIPVASG